MKKKCVLFFTMILIGYHSFSQLAVLDQIVGSLIPGITKGITEVLDKTKRGKVETKEVEKLQEDVKKQIADLYGKMATDQGNIDVLNNVFSRTMTLLGPASSMQTICVPEIIDAVSTTHNIALYRETVRQFQASWAQFEDQFADLSKIQFINNPPLQTQLTNFATQVGRHLKNLKSDIKFGTTPTSASSLLDLENYISNLKSSSVKVSIDGLINQIENLNVNLTSYISTFSASLKAAQKANQ